MNTANPSQPSPADTAGTRCHCKPNSDIVVRCSFTTLHTSYAHPSSPSHTLQSYQYLEACPKDYLAWREPDWPTTALAGERFPYLHFLLLITSILSGPDTVLMRRHNRLRCTAPKDARARTALSRSAHPCRPPSYSPNTACSPGATQSLFCPGKGIQAHALYQLQDDAAGCMERFRQAFLCWKTKDRRKSSGQNGANASMENEGLLSA